ncbi:MAG TPA: nucleotidyltransferase domain-containing protein [Candidatus Cloacimonetes bacterium]|nr:nucleotidyltransferase domain-containing protein [Candidatus Cloacimonadota bacterium]
MHKYIKQRLEKIQLICEDYNIKKLYIFGSSSTNTFNEHESDIDLIVELKPMDPLKKGETLMGLWEKFELLFQRKVDLLSKIKVRNPYLQNGIDQTKELIYEA